MFKLNSIFFYVFTEGVYCIYTQYSTIHVYRVNVNTKMFARNTMH